MRRTALALSFLWLCGCHTATPPVVYGNERGEDVAGPVAIVDGRPITKGILADHWFARYREEYARTLGDLVDERIVVARAHRDGIRIAARDLAEAVEREVKARRAQVAETYGEGSSLEAEVRRAYGLDVEAWKQTILAPRLHVRLLMERVIRWDTRRRERLIARVIVVEDARTARAVAEKLARGADFALTARQVSVDPSARLGGTLPSIARGDLAFPRIEARLFEAAPGQLVGPLAVRPGSRPAWHLYKVVERVPAWTGSAASRIERIEADLDAHPMTAAEYERWRARVHREAGVRYYASDGRLWEPGGR